MVHWNTNFLLWSQCTWDEMRHISKFFIVIHFWCIFLIKRMLTVISQSNLLYSKSLSIFRPLKPDVNTDTSTSYPLDSMIFIDRNKSMSNLFTIGILFHQEFVEMLPFVQNVQLHYNNKLTIFTVYCLNLRLLSFEWWNCMACVWIIHR